MEELSDLGTLSSLLELYGRRAEKMDPIIVVYYAIELLRMAETLHKIGIIHADISPDNLLILNEETEEVWKDWQPGQPTSCWSNKGLRLVDFNRSIDTTLYPSNTVFHGDAQAESVRCIEMQIGLPWTFQVDLYGICSTIYTMISGGSPIEIVQNPTTNAFEVKEPLSRYERYEQHVIKK
jgi:checkpoint serine/threonine-protein kinase